MKYHRVLYTNNFTSELKCKLRITSYNKPRSIKGNVYYVSFATDNDIKYADRACKRLHNVTLKPFQPRSSFKDQFKRLNNTYIQQETVLSSTVPLSTSPLSLLSPPTTLTFLTDHHSLSSITRQSSMQRTNETLEERALSVLGPHIAAYQSVTPIRVVQSPKPIDVGSSGSIIENSVTVTANDKQHIIENVHSCLRAMDTARWVADEVCQLYRRGSDCRTVLDNLFKVHSTAFYLKASTSTQIGVALSTGVRLSWSEVVKSIDAFRTDVRHEQQFMTEIASAKYILSKIDCMTSIAMSSKLAYQLTKLSY